MRVWVVTDYSYRERPHWDTVLAERFRAMNGIFRGTGLEWRVVSAEHLDPVASIRQLDARRVALESRVDAAGDVVVAITAEGEKDRLGSVIPFSHTLVVVDFPKESEERNTLNLAHELGRLFGAPEEPAGSGTVMAVPPGGAAFASRTIELFRQLRDYDFAAGVSGLNDFWKRKAVQALAAAQVKPSPKPLAQAHTTLALALASERRPAEALPEAREAVKADLESLDAREILAHALIDDSQPDEAIHELRDALRIFPNEASLHALLGSVLGSQAETEEALKELHTAETLDPQNANYPVALGALLVSQTARMDEGVAEFQKAVRLDPQLEAARYWLHRMEYADEQARADLDADQRAERGAPQDSNVHYRLGIDEARLGHTDIARQEFQKSVQLNPHNGPALANLAAMDIYAKDYRAARQHVDAARATGFEPSESLLSALARKEKEIAK